MNIETAIQSLDLIANKGRRIILDTDREAMRLGIEALKYFKNDRLYCQKIAQQLLPGETAKEKEAK